MKRALCAGLAIAVLAGCGGEDERDAAPTAAPAASEASALTITFHGDKDAQPRRLALRCPGDACERIARVDAAALESTPADVACAEIYGGPQIAELTGTLDGRTVKASFARTDACEIDRWDRVIGALAPNLAIGPEEP